MATIFQAPTAASGEASLKDTELTAAAARGDAQAQRQLMERVFERVRRSMSYLAGGGADAEDLTQMALVEILKSAGNFRGDSSLEYWADRVAVQTAAKLFARHKRRRSLMLANPAIVEDPFCAGETLDRLMAKKRLAELLAKISRKNREALTIRYVLGHSLAETASLCGCPVNTIRGRLREGRKQMKKLIAGDPVLRQWSDRRDR